ncbi:hypothetical protein [Paraburkholderia humisilvae]|uniref:Uncharacterized protein n=1 Tax=Paraburkholderia humisilvae TaxID=627669 RepID=A0A6J5DQ24_9BURK|nr:hypothetical protein [Paraburkholderia humisilvae]CAB3754956.1 hypothetical protein LMG29542_02502 [Paraburkholderia humisilvae]
MRILPLPYWCDEQRTVPYAEAYEAEKQQTRTERSLRASEMACVEFARRTLPTLMVAAFERHGAAGRCPLLLVAKGDSLTAFPDLRRLVGVNEWRAARTLQAQPEFQGLVDACLSAYDDYTQAKIDEEEATLAYQISIEETYRQIERDDRAEIRDECAELGLV